MGLNTEATGWHYFAAMCGQQYDQGRHPSPEPGPSYGWQVVRNMSQVMATDTCTCWCNIPGKGCSPLKSFWKTHGDGICDMVPVGRTFPRARELLHHVLFHHSITSEGSQHNELSSLTVELVRFLTFEILDMTHTCCSARAVDATDRRLYSTPPGQKSNWGAAIVIANCSPEIVEQIRSDDLERKNADQLDDLMSDFTNQLRTLDCSSPLALQSLIWGYWRCLMFEFFAVDSAIVNDMERITGPVQTRKFLRPQNACVCAHQLPSRCDA